MASATSSVERPTKRHFTPTVIPSIEGGEVTILDGTVGARIGLIEDREIASEDDAHAIMKEAAKVKRELEADRKTTSEPYLRAKQMIDRVYKAEVERCDEVITSCKKILKVFVRKRADEERQRRERENAEHVDERPTPPLIPRASETRTGPKVVTRKVETLEIVDFDAIPRAYLKLDEAKVKEARAAGIEIPGIAYKTDEEVIAR